MSLKKLLLFHHTSLHEWKFVVNYKFWVNENYIPNCFWQVYLPIFINREMHVLFWLGVLIQSFLLHPCENKSVFLTSCSVCTWADISSGIVPTTSSHFCSLTSARWQHSNNICAAVSSYGFGHQAHIFEQYFITCASEAAQVGHSLPSVCECVCEWENGQVCVCVCSHHSSSPNEVRMPDLAQIFILINSRAGIFLGQKVKGQGHRVNKCKKHVSGHNVGSCCY